MCLRTEHTTESPVGRGSMSGGAASVRWARLRENWSINNGRGQWSNCGWYRSRAALLEFIRKQVEQVHPTSGWGKPVRRAPPWPLLSSCLPVFPWVPSPTFFHDDLWAVSWSKPLPKLVLVMGFITAIGSHLGYHLPTALPVLMLSGPHVCEIHIFKKGIWPCFLHVLP